MKFKICKILSSFIIIPMLVSCSKEATNSESKINPPIVNEINNELLSYENYESLFEHLVNTLKIDGLELKASTIDGNLTFIEKDLSFNKREYLTLDGTDSMETTEEQIVLENKDQSKQITIGVFFTNSYIGNDLVGWPNNVGFKDLNQDLVKSTNYAIITYKNLIITIHQSSTHTADLDTTKNVIRAVEKALNEYDYKK